MMRRFERQRGVAAIELALCLAASLLLLQGLFSVSSVFLHYAALQKAVHEGARYMAALPPQALSTKDAADLASATVRDIVVQTAQQAGLQVSLAANDVVVTCGKVTCKGSLPQTITVTASVIVTLPANLLTIESNGRQELNAVHTMRYGYPAN